MSDVTEKESLDALKVMLKRVADEVDYFTLLDIEPGANVEATRLAFFKLARSLHPDLPAFKPPALRADATKVFQSLSRAHKVLTDPNLRAQYLSAAGVSEEDSGPQEPNPDLARIHMHRSRQLLGRRDWAAAEEGLQLAVTLFGDEENYDCKTMLGWAIMHNPQRTETERARESKALWEQVLESQKVTSAEAQAAYYMAIWCKLHGEMGKVKKYLDRCLKVEPRHIEAQRELRNGCPQRGQLDSVLFSALDVLPHRRSHRREGAGRDVGDLPRSEGVRDASFLELLDPLLEDADAGGEVRAMRLGRQQVVLRHSKPAT